MSKLLNRLKGVETNMNGIEKFHNRLIVCRFLDENDNVQSVIGTLTECQEDITDIDERCSIGYVCIESETDFDRIPLDKVRKIYLK